MKRFTAITHICLCQVSMTVTVLLLAVGIGLVPSPYKLLFKSRVQLCENLAIQLCSAPEEQLPDVFNTLAPLLVERNDDILSMGFRTQDGHLLSHTENHFSFWKAANDSKDASHIELPLFQNDLQIGTIEICFIPVFVGFFGMLQSMHFPLFVFIGLLLFVMFRFYLRHVLRYLDPSSVVPGRVKTVLDNLSESVVVIDNQEQIVFANQAFTHVTEKTESDLVGRKLSGLSWIHPKVKEDTSPLPWQNTIQEGSVNVNVPLVYQDQTGQARHSLVNTMPIVGADGTYKGIMTSFTDVTEIEQKNKELLEMSRSAGMAEVATNVLHNVGNILNSVNVSTSFIVRKLSESKLSKLHEIAKMISEHSEDLSVFLTEDSRGKYIPSYLLKTTDNLLGEQRDILEKLESLQSNVEHLKETICMQQSYAREQDCDVLISVRELVEDAVQMSRDMLQTGTIDVIQEYDETQYLYVDKSLVLQILVNLIRNAVEALHSSKTESARLVIRCSKTDDETFQIEVRDNGPGISQENCTKIFRHGFTTKQHGHGFGLHGSALNARKMNGSLTVHSEGEGKGATFTLTLPLKSEDQNKGTHDVSQSAHFSH